MGELDFRTGTERQMEKPWYRRTWFILLVVLLLFALSQQKQIPETGQEIPQQESKKTDAQILAEIESRFNEYQEKLKRYYPDDDMIEALGEDAVKLAILEVGYGKPANDEQRRILAKAKAISPKLDALRREVYARTLERNMVARGLNTEIRARGKDKEDLEYKYALMSRAVVYKLVNEGNVLGSARKAGFLKVTFTDGQKKWTYDLGRE